MTDHQTIFGKMQHQDHRKWLNQLDFCQDEIKIFQNELMRVLHEHPNYLSMIEHVDEYREILLKKLQHIDEFRCQIILHERELTLSLDPGSEGLWDHNQLRNDLLTFFSDYEVFKRNFRRFVAHND